MAKMEYRLRGCFDDILNIINSGIMGGSITASYEDGSDINVNGVRCAVRVYERYSVIGSNRVSLNVTLMGTDNEIYLSAITSGGSQATFFKINTLGEEAFLEKLHEVIKPYIYR
ncbi:MAG: hypothetical protein IJ072_06470 [Oscillospiraceae bacterium]|nr:hypothetical protein [Oscillospiraceae bacterium]